MEDIESKGSLWLERFPESVDSVELVIANDLSINLLRSSLSFSLACKYSAETKNWVESLFLREFRNLGDLLSDSSFFLFSSPELLFSSFVLSASCSLLSELCLVNWQNC